MQELVFQPTLPSRGVTDSLSVSRLLLAEFQPTLPSRGVTATFNKFLFHILCRIDNYLSNDPTCFQLFCALFSVRISREFYEYLLFALEIYCADAALRCLGRTP